MPTAIARESVYLRSERLLLAPGAGAVEPMPERPPVAWKDVKKR